MATQPTQNPVPSESPRDLKFNAGKIDEFVTSLALRYTDRFGYQHYTIEGLRQLAQEAISGFGWVLKQSFEDGVTLTLPNEALLWSSNGEYYRWSGALPKSVPAGSTPDNSGGIGQGAWVGIGDAALKTMLASSVGASMIGMEAGGNLQQIIHYVTPEQFGAIGDGTIHPLSEQYVTLAAAQSVYPFATALTQTIDWAACQAAENFARGKLQVKPRPYASYHFDRDGLLIDQYSQWVGVAPTTQEKVVTEFVKTFPIQKPVFQQDYIVRVAAGNNDSGYDYKAGIRFEGIRLRYAIPRRYPTKGSNTICFHAGNMIKSNIDLSTWGGEYGMYTWISWGNKGHQRHDNCHKGYWSVPNLKDNERSGNGTTTSNHYRIETDVTPYPITIGSDNYSHYTGFFEGSVASDGNYDNANETACGITIIGTVNNCSFTMGIERFEGVHVTKAGGSLTADCTFRFSPYSDASYLMSSGNDGSDSSLRIVNDTSASKVQLPPNRRAYFNVLAGRSIFNIEGSFYYLGNIEKETASKRYFVNISEAESIFNFIGGQVGFVPEAGMAPIEFCPVESMKSQVTATGCRGLDLWCAPTTAWRLIGLNRWVRVDPMSVNGTLSAGNGYYADFIPPSGYKVTDVKRLTTNLGDTGTAIGFRPSLYAYNSVNGSARAGTSYSGGTIPIFNGIPEVSI